LPPLGDFSIYFPNVFFLKYIHFGIKFGFWPNRAILDIQTLYILYYYMYSTFGFGEYYRRKRKREEKLKFFGVVIFITIVGIGVMFLFGFLASLI